MTNVNNTHFYRRPVWRFCLLLWLGSWPAMAQNPDTTAVLSIQDCIDFAGQNNSQIKIARFDEQIARQQTNEVRGRGLPQATINGTYENRLKIPLLVIPGATSALGGDSTGGTKSRSQGIPLGYKYNSSLTGEVTQMIFDPSFWIGLKAARYSSQFYQQSTQQVSEQAAYNIASAYYQVIVVQKQWQLLQSNLLNTQKTLEMTELQFRNGVAKQVDVNRLRVNVSNLQSQIRQAESSLVQATNSLKVGMGMPISKPIVLSDTALAFRQEEAVLSNGPGSYEENRIDYKILRTNIELQNLDRKNNLVGYYPTLTAYANYGYQSQGPTFAPFKMRDNGWVDYTTSALGLRLRIPVFDGLQRNARVQQSKLKISQLEENLHLTQQNITMEVANALNVYQSTLQRIGSEEQNVQVANEVYQVTQLEFREGVSTSTDVVNAETALREAQTNYTTTLLDLYKARLDLERAKGNLFPYLNSK